MLYEFFFLCYVFYYIVDKNYIIFISVIRRFQVKKVDYFKFAGI